ncbi:MAG: 1-acyl-sn-glycerol-3-phosphate acyltransferase [Planctomycetota bacterium]
MSTSPHDSPTLDRAAELPALRSDWAPAPQTDFVYGCIQLWARTLLGSFYDLQVIAGEVPTDGPLIVCSNHSNGLADAGLLFRASPRPLRPLAKQPLFEMPVIGWLVRKAGSVPVHRRQDGADTSKNAEAFQAVADALGRSETIFIFPEGTTGFEPKLQRFRSGAARLAVQGDRLESGEGLRSRGLRIVPLGLIYADRDRYGTPAYAWVGLAFEAREFWNGEDYDVDALTRRIRSELERVCVEAEDWPRMRLVRFGEELLPADGRSVPERWQALARDWSALESEAPEEWTLLREELEGFESEVRRTKPEPGLRKLGRALVQLAWGLPAWGCRKIGRLGQPRPDKLVTVQLLASTVLMPTWALVAIGSAAGLAGAWGALGTAVFLAIGAKLAPHCASAYRARPAGALAEALGERLAARLSKRAAGLAQPTSAAAGD